MGLNALIQGSSGEGGLYPGAGLITGCIFWSTGRRASDRGCLGFITGSLRYLTLLVWHHVQTNGAGRDERHLGLRLVIDQIFLFCVGAGVYRRKSTRLVPVQSCQPKWSANNKVAFDSWKRRYAIYCHNNYGPSFGSNNGLRIANASNSCNCSISRNNSYQCLTGQNADTFLTGSQNSKITEMEVYVFQK